MRYCSASETAKRWKISTPLVRRYCVQGRIIGAVYKNDAWLIPEDAEKPGRQESKSLEPQLAVMPPLAAKLYHQMNGRNYHGLYDYTQINLTYNSCRMASCRLTRGQVELIFRKGKVGGSFELTKVSDLIEVMNHCAAVDYILRHIMDPLSQQFIKRVHRMLTYGTVDQRRGRVRSGEYRTSSAGPKDLELIPADAVNDAMGDLILEYKNLEVVELEDILDFHVQFERIFPFEDYNGRTGRLIMFKECLRHDVMPFIIDDKKRSRYLEGIRDWNRFRRKLINLATELQERYAAQVELQKMFASNKAMNNAEYFEEVEDEDEEVDG